MNPITIDLPYIPGDTFTVLLRGRHSQFKPGEAELLEDGRPVGPVRILAVHRCAVQDIPRDDLLNIPGQPSHTALMDQWGAGMNEEVTVLRAKRLPTIVSGEELDQLEGYHEAAIIKHLPFVSDDEG